MTDSTQLLLYVVAFINGSLCAIGFYIAWKLRLPCYHPMILFQVYFSLGFALRPLAIAMDGGSKIWDRTAVFIGGVEILHAALTSIVYYCVFVFTSLYLTHKFKSTNSDFRIPPSNVKIFIQRDMLFRLCCYCIISIGVFVTWKMIQDRGSSMYSFQIEVDDKGKQRMVGESGYFTMMAEWPIVGIMLLTLRYGLSIETVTFTAVFFLIRMYVGAQRLSFVAIALILMLYIIIQRRKYIPPLKYIIPAYIVLSIFNLIGEDRLLLQKIREGNVSFSLAFEKDETKTSNLADHTAHFAEFDMLCAVVTVVPKPLGYNYFSQYLRIITWPIPRQIWKDKPVVTARVNFHNAKGNFFGLTLSSIGDSYTNFGIFGVWIMAIVWSTGLTKIYLKMCGNYPGPYIATLFFIVCAFISTIFRDGGVVVIYFTLVTLLPAYIIIYISKPIRQIS